MEALIPAPDDYDVQSVIKFLKNKQCRMLSASVVLLHNNTVTHGFMVNTSPAGVQKGGVQSSTL